MPVLNADMQKLIAQSYSVLVQWGCAAHSIYITQKEQVGDLGVRGHVFPYLCWAPACPRGLLINLPTKSFADSKKSHVGLGKRLNYDRRTPLRLDSCSLVQFHPPPPNAGWCRTHLPFHYSHCSNTQISQAYFLC